MLQPVPVIEQFLLVQLRPGLHRPPLPGRERSGDHIDRVNADDCHLILPVRVEMRDMMLAAVVAPGYGLPVCVARALVTRTL